MCAASSQALAQPAGADAAAAEVLFNEGRALMGDGDARAACPKFEQSLALERSAGTALNLATCYEALDRTASAWAGYLAAARIAREHGRPVHLEAAEQGASKLEPQLSYLVVEVPDAGAPDLLVLRDGTPMAAASLGTRIPVDPGVHALHASAEGHHAWHAEIEVPAGPGETRVQVPPLKALPSGSASVSDALAVPAEDSSVAPGPTALPQPTLFGPTFRPARLATTAVALGAGAASLALGLTVMLKDFELRDGCGAERRCEDDVLDRQRSLIIAADATGAVAVAAAIAAFALWRAGSNRDARLRARLSPTGAWLEGAF